MSVGGWKNFCGDESGSDSGVTRPNQDLSCYHNNVTIPPVLIFDLEVTPHPDDLANGMGKRALQGSAEMLGGKGTSDRAPF
jgi:hypothetical protein